MDANTPGTGSTSDGNPVQDHIEEIVTDPEAEGPSFHEPAPHEAAAKDPAVTAPARPRGPNASAIVIAVVAMVFAGLVIAKETMGLRLDWSRLGPGGIVGIGILMVVIGAVGLVRRRDDV